MRNDIDFGLALTSEFCNALNKQQLQAIRIISEVFQTEPYFALNGYAGTGKTYTAGIFLKLLLDKNPALRICCVAPSHKAKKLLKRSIESQGITGLTYCTVASFLGKAPEFDQKKGKEVFTKVSDIDDNFDFIFIDEYGMISEDDSRQLLGDEFDCKFLFMGDDAQLPPVGEDFSYIASLQSIHSFQLTEVVRYGGDLARVAASYIKLPNSMNGLPIIGTTEDDDSILLLPTKRKQIELFCEDLEIAFEKNDPSYCKFICYTNKAASGTNHWIREEFFKELANDFSYIKDEFLVAKKPIQRMGAKGKFEIVLENSIEFKVLTSVAANSAVSIRLDGITYEYYIVPAIAENGRKIDLLLLAAGQEKIFANHLTRIKARRDWKVWHQLNKYFDDVTYAYAVTCHKAQGSTYNYAYLDLNDLKKCKDRNRILYTAMTRAAKSLIVSKGI